MKLSLINPSPNEELRERIRGEASWPPLGLLYMATVLKEKGLGVSILDQPAKGYSIEDTVRWVEGEDPDVLGFSGLSMSGRTAALTSIEVKKTLPDLPIVFGGLYATFNAERVLGKYPSVDIVARGEGEETIVDLVDTLKTGGSLKEVQGIAFRDRDAVFSTPDRPLIEDLDSLPFPDRSLLDDEYHSDIGGANIAVKKFTSVISSRGCVYRCRFCSCHQLCRGRWRARSVDNTMEELHYLASEGYKQFIFIDDCFTLNPKRAIEICRRMREEKLDFEWICEGRVDSSSYEMLREISRAGCKIIYFGIESANQSILDYYEKSITPEQSVQAVETARRAGIDLIMGTFIVGAPDETREEIQNTLDFAKKLPIDLPQFNVLGIHPGMDIWNEMKAKGYVDEERYWETGVGVPRICPTAVPFQEIGDMIKDAVYDFALRPGFILGQIGRTLKSPYRLGVVLNNLGRLGEIRKTFQNPMG
jgi:anaerobic magnesium-protoporphyrin IX monomethyl ester cyclase